MARQGKGILIFDNVLLSGNAELKSEGIDIGARGDTAGIWYKQTSDSGVPNATLCFQQSIDDVDANYATPVKESNIFTSLQQETPYLDDITPITMRYFRFKLNGVATGAPTDNPTDTRVTLWLYKQEA